MSDIYEPFTAAHVHGLPLNLSSLNKAVTELEKLIALRKSHYVCFCEGNLFAWALRNAEVRRVLSEATLVYPDGIAVAQDLSWLLHNHIHRVAGPTFLLEACQFGQAKKWRHFFLGGAEGVAQKMAENLQKKFPDMIVAGIETPPFRPLTKEEDEALCRRIEAAHPDLLWVGLGGPKQEFWMNQHRFRLSVPVMLGVGAAFDFHSGNRPWAPWLVRKIGMEWLFRAVSGGRRTFIRNVKCVSITGATLLFDRVRFHFLAAEKRKEFPRPPDSGK